MNVARFVGGKSPYSLLLVTTLIHVQSGLCSAMSWLVVRWGRGRDRSSSNPLDQHLLLNIYRPSTAQKNVLPRNHTPQYTESTSSIIPRIIQLFSLSSGRETFSKIQNTKESISSQRKSRTELRILKTGE